MAPTSPQPLKFKKSISVLSGSTDIQVDASAPKDPQVAKALLNNDPFPKTPIVLGKVEVGISSGKEVSFGSGAGKVSFSGGGGVFGELGVYKTVAAVFKAAKINEEVLPAVALAGAVDKLFLVLRSGYRLEAGVKGSIALAPGLTPTVEGSASHRRAYAVIRAVEKDTGSRDAIQDVLDSWRLPRQVDEPSDLRPGTWLIAEIDSSFAMGIKAEYGYTYNWVRAAEFGGLSGDIGLKIQLGVSTSLGFNASGKYALVICRESLKATDRRLRMRLYRLSSGGWNFAFDAAAAFQADTSDFLPGQGYDRFIAGVLGLDPGQLMDDLRRWTDPKNSIPDLIAGETIDIAEEVLTEVTGIDAKAEFNEAKGKLQGLLKKWDELPNEVASRIWEALPLPGEIAQIAKIANQIKGADSASAKKRVNNLIAEKLEDVDFFDTAVGKWLLAAAMDEPLKLLAAAFDSKEFKEFQKIAGRTASILDGSALQEMLGKLHDYISKMLRIDDLRGEIDEATFEKYENWLKAKLSQFLGEQIDFAKIDKIREAIHLLDSKAEDFYQKTIKAINNEYAFSFAYRYQSTTTKTALLDFTFDFKKGDRDKLSRALRKVLETGDFNELLTKKQDGVHLHMAALTHDIKRQASVDLTMPWIHERSVSRSEALAKLDAIDDDDGRLLMYSIDAKNKVTKVTTRGRAQSYRASTFAIAGALPVRPGQVRVHSTRSLTQSYAYEIAEQAMTLEDLVDTMGPYATAYFPAQFGSPETRFAIWAEKLDRRIDAANPETASEELLFGDTLIRLKVELPGTLGAVWFDGPTEKTAERYLQMSLRMQRKLRQLMMFYFFSDAENIKKKKLAAHALLMYAAVPPSNAVKATASGGLKRTNKKIHWDWANRTILRRMMARERTTVGLTQRLGIVRARLARIPGGDKFMNHYDTPRRIRQTLRDPNALTILKALFRMESGATRKAVDAAVYAAKFKQEQGGTPAEALEMLAKFGVAATEAFNAKLSGATYGDGPLRPLGSLLYVEALRALDPSGAGHATPVSTLQIEVLRNDVDIPDNFPDHEPFTREQLAIREMIVNVENGDH